MFEAQVQVWKRGGLTTTTVSAASQEKLAAKLDKLEEAGNLHAVVGFRDPA